MKTSISPKTTISGVITILLALLGAVLEFLNTGSLSGETLSVAATAVVTGFGLITARDNDKTSEETGATIFAADRERTEAGY